jgi:hypothetical protein
MAHCSRHTGFVILGVTTSCTECQQHSVVKLSQPLGLLKIALPLKLI